MSTKAKATNHWLEAAWIAMDVVTTLLGVCAISFIRWQFLDGTLSDIMSKITVSAVAAVCILPAMSIGKTWQMVNATIALYRSPYELYDVVDLLSKADIEGHLSRISRLRLAVEVLLLVALGCGIVWLLAFAQWHYLLAVRVSAILYFTILTIATVMYAIISKDIRPEIQ